MALARTQCHRCNDSHLCTGRHGYNYFMRPHRGPMLGPALPPQDALVMYDPFPPRFPPPFPPPMIPRGRMIDNLAPERFCLCRICDFWRNNIPALFVRAYAHRSRGRGLIARMLRLLPRHFGLRCCTRPRRCTFRQISRCRRCPPYGRAVGATS
ncbi:hypothetical protein EJ06DRAFT_29276 [Trichodelitschia bisporula]|uniref:Uncharacterized protein n=1 Tax=Trichodelitschia bisporula TaxID=703511 RepID=A0A6G1IB47_9PEZI|nr:hypothetical protein EJ06DRAFT_29276 [Trichodelitschia bisporula]